MLNKISIPAIAPSIGALLSALLLAAAFAGCKPKTEKASGSGRAP